MTVKELKDKLMQVDENKEVFVNYLEWPIRKVEEVKSQGQEIVVIK